MVRLDSLRRDDGSGLTLYVSRLDAGDASDCDVWIQGSRCMARCPGDAAVERNERSRGRAICFMTMSGGRNARKRG